MPLIPWGIPEESLRMVRSMSKGRKWPPRKMPVPSPHKIPHPWRWQDFMGRDGVLRGWIDCASDGLNGAQAVKDLQAGFLSDLIRGPAR
jgi:hypothetical protein